MNIKPKCICSVRNNQRCICHQRNLIYSLQCNIFLKVANNDIHDTKHGENVGMSF